MTKRLPVVAGQFYPADENSLRETVQELIKSDAKPEKSIAIISPHAGYMCSGKVAGEVFAKTIIPDKVILLSPSHTGLGEKVAIMTKGSWVIPTGELQIDEKLSSQILKNCGAIKEDESAHKQEHSLEVQLPFVFAKNPKAKIVPISLSHIPIETIEEIGNAIAKTIQETKEDVLIIASSDMNHYESDEITKEKDELALKHVYELDYKGLLKTCAQKHITMCGVVPTAVAIVAAKQLGAEEANLVKYDTSGKATGDYSSVVGYAGVVIR